MCFSVLALYCKQSKMGVKSSREQWLKKVKCAAGLVKIWVGRVSNAFCEQALSQNSFFRPSSFAPFPKHGCPSGMGRKFPLFPARKPVLCTAAWVASGRPCLQPCPYRGSTCRETRSPSAARAGDQWAAFFCSCPAGASPFSHLTRQLCCSWCATRLLGFGRLKLHRQAGLALGDRFLPYAGCDNWPWGGGGVALGPVRTKGKDLWLETVR